jgi:hypothetical protein
VEPRETTLRDDRRRDLIRLTEQQAAKLLEAAIASSMDVTGARTAVFLRDVEDTVLRELGWYLAQPPTSRTPARDLTTDLFEVQQASGYYGARKWNPSRGRPGRKLKHREPLIVELLAQLFEKYAPSHAKGLRRDGRRRVARHNPESPAHRFVAAAAAILLVVLRDARLIDPDALCLSDEAIRRHLRTRGARIGRISTPESEPGEQ